MMNKILIYGPGCAKCTALAELAKQVVQELGVTVSVEKVTDAMQFAVAGVLVTPALAVDGKILFSGKVPSKEELKKILKDAFPGQCDEGEACGCCAQKTGSLPSAGADDACGCGGCCSDAPKCCGGWKRAVVWVVAILILLAVVKMINRQSNEQGRDSVGSVDTVGAGANAVTLPVEVKSGVDVVYFEYGARCVTCIRMETWAREVVNRDFASELKDGRLSFRAVPADEASVKKYGLETKSLIVRVMEDGKESRWVDLERIWDLSGDEEAFKAYVTENIRKQLTEAK